MFSRIKRLRVAAQIAFNLWRLKKDMDPELVEIILSNIDNALKTAEYIAKRTANPKDDAVVARLKSIREMVKPLLGAID